MKTKFVKVRFTSVQYGATAGLVFELEKFLAIKNVSDLSRFWPYSESLKMRRTEVSPHFETFDGAFSFNFSEKPSN